MVFSSAVFLFYFLPLTLLCVGGVRLLARGERFVRLRNLILLCASCVFYAWGEASLTLLLLLFAWINYRLALGLSASKHPRRWLLAGVGFDLALLIGVKYGPWLYGWAAQACVWIGLSRGAHPALEFALPLGISFYTFQSLSYLVDVYRGDAAPARRFSDFACYLLMFSQLVAGPIIRYTDMSAELLSDRGSAERMACGVKRFVEAIERPSSAGTVGAVVANCNPFTKGHRYLMETAASQCDFLHVFVLSAEKSLFPASLRFKMVKRGTSHLKNVAVHPTGDYLISAATFPDYFLKDRARVDDVKCELDLAIFVAISKCFS